MGFVDEVMDVIAIVIEVKAIAITITAITITFFGWAIAVPVHVQYEFIVNIVRVLLVEIVVFFSMGVYKKLRN